MLRVRGLVAMAQLEWQKVRSYLRYWRIVLLTIFLFIDIVLFVSCGNLEWLQTEAINTRDSLAEVTPLAILKRIWACDFKSGSIYCDDVEPPCVKSPRSFTIPDTNLLPPGSSIPRTNAA